MDNPTFSIIIPVYNVAPYLRECLDSVLNQTYTDWEAICVNDGSTDGSSEILDEYAKRDRRFNVFHKKNEGVSVARNLALDSTHGSYVTFLDADDVIHAKWLKVANDILSGLGVDLLRMSFVCFDDGCNLPRVSEQYTAKSMHEKSQILSWGWRTYLQHGFSWLNFYRRDTTPFGKGFYRYPEGVSMREDNIFTLRNLEWIKSAVVCDFAGYYYRQHLSSSWRKHHPWSVQHRFRVLLKQVWKSSLPMLKSIDGYPDLESLYDYHMHWRFNVGRFDHSHEPTRFTWIHIKLAILRRITRLKERLG